MALRSPEASPSQSLTHTSENVFWVVLGNYSNHDPALAFKHLKSPNVLDVLNTIRPMLVAVYSMAIFMSSQPMSKYAST
jgi:hypothetical protein